MAAICRSAGDLRRAAAASSRTRRHRCRRSPTISSSIPIPSSAARRRRDDRAVTPAPSRRRSALAAACFGACSTTPAPKLYTLAPRPAPPINRPVATIAVKPVEIAKYLDRTQIVRRTDPYELEALEFDRWGEGLAEMVTGC